MIQLAAPRIPRMCGGSAGLGWYVITMAARKKATAMLPVFFLTVEVMKWAFPVEDLPEALPQMELLVAVLGKALFARTGPHARMLLATLYELWPQMHAQWGGVLFDTPTFKEALNYFECFLAACPDAHQSMGLKLEAMHQIITPPGKCSRPRGADGQEFRHILSDMSETATTHHRHIFTHI